jgi:bacterioferritin-associated ferredoxin
MFFFTWCVHFCYNHFFLNYVCVSFELAFLNIVFELCKYLHAQKYVNMVCLCTYVPNRLIRETSELLFAEIVRHSGVGVSCALHLCLHLYAILCVGDNYTIVKYICKLHMPCHGELFNECASTMRR